MTAAHTANERPPNADLWMLHRDLSRAPSCALPLGYRIRPYGEGDVRTWVRPQQAADPFYVAIAETFARSRPGASCSWSLRPVPTSARSRPGMTTT